LKGHAPRRIWTTLCGWLGWPAIGVLLGTVLAVCLSYQFSHPVAVDPGTSYARPYLEGFHEAEQGPGVDYAYTRAHAVIRFPGIGHGPALLEVRMGGGVAGVVQTLSGNGQPLLQVPAGGELASYSLLLPAGASAGGTLELAWDGHTRTRPDDPRSLGLAVDRVVWTPLRGAMEPDWWQVLWVALAALALYVLARQLALSPVVAGLCCAGFTAAISAGLVWARLYLTIFTPRLAALLVVLALLLPLLRCGAGALFRRSGQEPRSAVEVWLWRLTILAAVVKLAGVLYPHIIVLDVGPHSYRVFRFLSGDTGSLFLPNQYSLLGQTVGLEGGQFPYSPLFHILTVPLALLPLPLPLSMGLLNGILDVARNLLLFLLATGISGRQRVGLWAVVFYTFMPAPYYLLSWGNYPTQLGLWAALLALTFLVLSYEQLGRRPPWGWWVAVLVFAILSYTVVGVLTVVLLLLLVLLEPLLAAGPARRGRLVAILGGILLAEAVVFLLYHSNFSGVFWRETLPAIFQATRATGLAELREAPRESLLGNWLANWTFVGNHVTDLGVVFAGVGVSSLFVEPARRRWWPLLLAWVLIFPLFALFSGLVADMVLKHVFFMLPLLCLGAAVLAERLWRRGPAGRVAVLLYGLFMVWLSLSHWLDYVLVKRH
jgi:hypothetical protein